MNSYHIEHTEAYRIVRDYQENGYHPDKDRILRQAAGYLEFRKRVANFLHDHFQQTCTRNCFESRLSACCSREGIIAFFADVVINTMVSKRAEIDVILRALSKPNDGYKCVYLGEQGCMWRIKPIVCEMFLCNRAEETVFSHNSRLEDEWEMLRRQARRYQWPDRPVLFDWIEKTFIVRGYDAALMYLHKSPGLLMVKKKAGYGS